MDSARYLDAKVVEIGLRRVPVEEGHTFIDGITDGKAG